TQTNYVPQEYTETVPVASTRQVVEYEGGYESHMVPVTTMVPACQTLARGGGCGHRCGHPCGGGRGPVPRGGPPPPYPPARAPAPPRGLPPPAPPSPASRSRLIYSRPGPE